MGKHETPVNFHSRRTCAHNVSLIFVIKYGKLFIYLQKAIRIAYEKSLSML
jgi:hypothetical protein